MYSKLPSLFSVTSTLLSGSSFPASLGTSGDCVPGEGLATSTGCANSSPGNSPARKCSVAREAPELHCPPSHTGADGVNLKAGGAVGLRRRSCEKTQADGQGSNTRQGMLPHVCSSPRCAHHGALRGRTLAESRHARQISWRKVRLRRCHVSATPHQPIAVSTGAWIRDAPQRSDQSAPWSRNPRKRHREPSRQRSSRRLCHRHQPQ